MSVDSHGHKILRQRSYKANYRIISTHDKSIISLNLCPRTLTIGHLDYISSPWGSERKECPQVNCDKRSGWKEKSEI